MNLNLLFALPMLQYYVECLGWVLVHSLWQLALITLMAGVLLRCLRRRSAAIRHGVLVSAMCLSVALPAITAALQPAMPASAMSGDLAIEKGQSKRAEVAAHELQLPQTPHVVEEAGKGIPVMHPAEANEALAVSQEPASAGAGFALPWWDRAATLLRPWLAWIVAAWSLGVILCSLRPLLGWYMLSRLRQVGVSPASEEVLAALRRVSKRLGVRAAVRVLQSTLAQVPIVVGYVRPVILLPVSLATGLPISQLEAILAHELAHVRRHDFVVNLLQTLFETIFFYHPAAWWLSRQIRVEREHCCDDFVVALLGDKVEYGRALVAVESLRGNRAVLALSAADGSLLARVRRLAGRDTGRAATSPWSVGFLVSCCLGALLGVSVFSWPSLAEPREKEQAKFVAELMGGVKLELCGVLSGNVDSPEAWLPDGTKLEIPKNWPKLLRTRNEDPSHGFVLRATGLKKGQSIIWGKPGRWTTPILGDMVPEYVGFSTSVDGEKPIDIRIGVTDVWGPWQRVETSGKIEKRVTVAESHQPTYVRVELPLVFGGGSGSLKTGFALQGIAGTEDVADYEIVAVDPKGNRHERRGAGIWKGASIPYFGLAVDEIGHFEYRLRPFRQWVTFATVALQPGKATDVKITIASVTPIKPLLGPSPDRAKGQRMELVAWSPDSRQIYTTSTFQNLVRWDFKGEAITPRMVRVPHFAKSMVVSRKSGLVVLGTNEGVVQLWDGAALEEQSQVRFSSKYSTHAVAISPDESWLAGRSEDGSVDVFDIESERRLCHLGEGEFRGLSSLAFSADGTKLAALDQGHLALWTVPDGAKLAEWKFPRFAEHSTIHWSPDGETLAAVSDGQVALIQAKEGSVPRIVLAPDEIVMIAPNLRGIEGNGVRRGDVPDSMIAAGVMSISPSFKTVASAALDGSIAIWDIETRKIASKLAAPPGGREEKYPGLYHRRLSFSPNGRALACTREFEGDVVVWVLAPPDESVPVPATGAFKKRARRILQTPDDADPLPDIRLTGDEVSPAAIDQLAARKCGTVTLADAKLSGEIIERLRHAASIRTLRLFGTGLSGQIPRLEHVKGLVGLEVNAPLTGRDLEAIGQLSELQRLSLPQELTINVSGAREIARLVKLKSLRLYNVNIDDTSFVELRTLVGLEELDLTHTRITDAGLVTIERMPHLKTLELHRHPDWHTTQQLTDACLASIERLTELERLSLSGKISNDGLKQVARLPKLKSLMILATEINGEGLGTLADSKVETLVLGVEQLGPFSLGIEASTTLEQIPGLVNLKKCRTLKHIMVNGKFIGEASRVWPRLLPKIDWSFNS